MGQTRNQHSTRGWVLVLACMSFALVSAPAAGTEDVLLIGGDATDWGSRHPGETVNVGGRAFASNSKGRIHLGSSTGPQIGDYTASRRGTFETTATIPEDAEPGRATVVACRLQSDGSCAVSARATMSIEEATPSPTPTQKKSITAGTPTPTASQSVVAPKPPPPAPTIVAESRDPVPPFPQQDPPLVGDPATPLPSSITADVNQTIPNLAISYVEVTQGLQDLDNKFPLVAERRTFVRVMGTTEGENNQTGVMAALEGIRVNAKTETSLGLVYAENTPVHWDRNPKHRLVHDRIPYFVLPSTWTSGTLKLRVWVWAVDPTANNEPKKSDNLAELTVSFDHALMPHLYFFPVYLTEGYEPDGDPVIYETSQGYLLHALQVLRQLPVRGIVAHAMENPIGDENSNFDLTEGCDGPNAPLGELHELDGKPEHHHYIGMVHPSMPTQFGGCGTSSAVWAKMHSSFSNAFPWRMAGGSTIAHELGHNMGIAHAPCKFVPGDNIPGEVVGGETDPLFPGEYGWPNCRLAPTKTDGFFGFDAYWETSEADEPSVMTNDPSLGEPWKAYPWMGYRHPGWTDPWHGCLVLQFYDVSCSQTELIPSGPGGPDADPNTGGGIPGTTHGVSKYDCNAIVTEFDLCKFSFDLPPEPSVDETGDYVVTGTIDPEKKTATIERAIHVPEAIVRARAPERAPDDGDAVLLAMIDEQDAVQWLAEVDMPEPPHGLDHSRSDSLGYFQMRVPAVPTTKKFVLISREGVVASLAPTRRPPVATVRKPIVKKGLSVEIEASDPDGDDVSAYLQYRPSDDAPWQSIAAHVAPGRFRLPSIANLASSEDGMLRLLVTDGFHTTISTVGGVRVPPQAPRPLIVWPTDGSSRSAGRVVDLQGQAIAPGGVALEGDALRWQSNRDGDLGSGSRLATSTLSIGRHKITLTGTTPEGIAASTSIRLTITPSDLPPVQVRSAVAAALRVDERRMPTTAITLAGVTMALVTSAALMTRKRRRASLGMQDGDEGAPTAL